MVRHGIEELILHPEKYKEYEPANGWGTVESAIRALKSIEKWFQDGNHGGLAGTWNADVPFDCIWIAW